jgi:hypothetical protein
MSLKIQHVFQLCLSLRIYNSSHCIQQDSSSFSRCSLNMLMLKLRQIEYDKILQPLNALQSRPCTSNILDLSWGFYIPMLNAVLFRVLFVKRVVKKRKWLPNLGPSVSFYLVWLPQIISIFFITLSISTLPPLAIRVALASLSCPGNIGCVWQVGGRGL